MSLTVCLCANTLYYPEGGGHLWVYLNWALGIRSLDCRVIWLEEVVPSTPAQDVQRYLASLFSDLNQAARSLDTVAADYERQSRLARALAEEYFDARKTVARVLERSLA